LSGAEVALFVVQTKPGRIFATGFLLSACSLGLLEGIFEVSGMVSNLVPVAFIFLALFVLSRLATNYWAEVDRASRAPSSDGEA
jgi:hypothetical protein